MKNRLLPVLVAVVAVGCVETVSAQRGGGGRRGPPESIRSRTGSWFVKARLPSGDAKSDLATTTHVVAAAKKGHLSLLYLYDPRANAAKHERFEQLLFGNQAVSVALKFFQSGRIDVSPETTLAKKAPLFVAFDKTGKRVGEVSMRGYKASTSKLLGLLNRAGKGYSKISVDGFVKKYRSFLGDLQKIENNKRNLSSKRERLLKKGKPQRAKEAALTKDEESLAKKEAALFEGEEKLLADGKIPPQAQNAQRVGGRRRGRRR